MAYPTNSDIKTWLNISGSGDDTLLTAVSARVKAFIERETGEVWESASGTKYFHAIEDVDRRDLYTPFYTAITSVTNGDGNVVAATDYVKVGDPYSIIRLEARSGKYWKWTAKDDPTDAIVVVADWGAYTELPADVFDLALELCAWFYRQRDTNVNAQILAVRGGSTLLTPAKLPETLVARLAGLRRIL